MQFGDSQKPAGSLGRAARSIHHGPFPSHCEQANWDRRGLSSTPTCFGTLAGTLWPIGGMIRGGCRLIWVTATSSTRCATPSFRQRGLRSFGVNEVCEGVLRSSRSAIFGGGGWPSAPSAAFAARCQMVAFRLMDKKGERRLYALFDGVACSLTRLRFGGGTVRGRSGVHYCGCR